MSYLIAFNLPQYTDERIIRDIFYQNKFYSISVDFHKNCGRKSAIITIGKKCNINDIIINRINKTKINGVYLDLICADEEIKTFLINNKKTIYFQFTSFNATRKSIKSEFKKYGTVAKFNFDAKSLIGSVTFEMTECALKAKDELNQKKIKGSTITIKLTNFDSSLSFFFEQIQKNKETITLKNGNESSIFVFDIPEELDEKALRKIFDKFNVIKEEDGVVINKRFNYDSKITKYAIVTFDTRSSATNAIKELNYNKYNGVPIRLVSADSETIKILATNKGKLLISNLEKDIEASKLHDAFANYGDIIECEIPTDDGVSRGYGYVHFRDENDAIKATTDLSGASINGKKIYLDYLEDPSPFDLEKKYLKEINIKNKYFTQKDTFKFQKFLIPDFSLFDKNDDFVIFVNDKKIECNRFIASFFSPKISYNIQNDDSFSHFVINIVSLDKIDSINLDIVNFLVPLLNENPSRSKLQQLIINIIEGIISSTIEKNLELVIETIIDECSGFLLGFIEYIHKNDDDILTFILLIEIFTQFGNDLMIQYANSYFFNSIDKYGLIKNDQALYIIYSIRKINKSSDERSDVINYIQHNFTEIDPQILNKIDSKTIEKSISQMKSHYIKINEDKLLYKILRLKDDYIKQFIHIVDFEKVTNEAMKFFLSSISFSIFSCEFFKSISKRLSLKLQYTEDSDDSDDEKQYDFSNIFSNFIKCGINNSLSKKNINDKDFSIFIESDNKKIDINSKIATIISPIIKRNFQTDKTFSTFYLRFGSQVNFFNKFIQSISFFISKEEKIYEFDKTTIENKLFDLLTQMNNMIDNQGINYLTIFFVNLHIEEKNPFNYAGWILLFICLGNLSISEFLINLFIKSYDPEITSVEDVVKRLHHKEVLKYQDSLEVDISSEKIYIINNFEDFFTNILSLDDINENLWKILSIRLSVDVRIEHNDYHSMNYFYNYNYSNSSDSDIA